ncbi:MAG: hypothetical protein ACYDAR_19525 [Thermomicrobiales bacterium]
MSHETTLRISRDLAVAKQTMVAAKHPWAVEVALDILDSRRRAACAAPLIDCARPELLVDDRVPAGTRAKLREMGHNVVDCAVSFAPRVFAHPTEVLVDPATGLHYGGADPLSIGIAAGR